LEDEAQHRVIEILSRLGRGEEAVQEYETYAALLAQEGLEPLDETKTLAAEIRASDSGIRPLRVERSGKPDQQADDQPVTGQKRRFPVAGIIVAAIAVIGIGAGILLSIRSEPTGPALDPQRVLVLPPDNETDDPNLDNLGLLAQEWITHGVTHMGPLRAVPAPDVIQMLEAGMTRESVAVERNAGTLVSGRFFRARDSLEFHVRISDQVRGEVWHALDPILVSAVEPEPGLKELKDRVAGSLAVRFIPGSALPEPSLLDPPAYPAFQAIMDAAEFVARGDWAGALPHAERAARLDTSFYRARLLVAAALSNLGEHARADSVLDELVPSRDRFSEYERLTFQSGRARLRGDWEGRMAAARQGARQDPGGTLHYSSAGVALAAGRPREALELYSTLNPHCPWAPDIVSSWSYWTGAHHLLGRHRKELAEAGRARGHHPDRLEALFLELRALAALGWVQQLFDKLPEALTMPPESGWSAGTIFVRVAAELRAHGHPEEASRVLSSGLEWYQARPEEERSGRTHGLGFADALLMAGQLSEAEEVLESLRENHSGDRSVLGRLGVLYARLGSAAELPSLVAALESTRRPYDFGSVDYWHAAVSAWSGQEEEALSRLRRAISDGLRRGIALHADPLLEPLWSLPAFSLAVAEES
jgi:thioredoxin-like negative regulator of GroEL